MLRLGHTVEEHKPVELSLDKRRQGTYTIQPTEMGTSILLRNTNYQDLLDDNKPLYI